MISLESYIILLEWCQHTISSETASNDGTTNKAMYKDTTYNDTTSNKNVYCNTTWNETSSHDTA